MMDSESLSMTSETSHGRNIEIIMAGLAFGMWNVKKDTCNWDIILVFQFKHEKLDFAILLCGGVMERRRVVYLAHARFFFFCHTRLQTCI